MTTILFPVAPALALVGISMMMSLRDLASDDWTDFIPACVPLPAMPLPCGIEFGIVSSAVAKS